MEPLKVFIGWDSREDIAYQVAKFSLLRRASVPVTVTPIQQYEQRLKGNYWRAKDKASTEFSLTRFLTPFLAESGWALFTDCDFLFMCDIKELFDQADPNKAVMCVHHDYKPSSMTKMDGQEQTVYPRKNWSSCFLINCDHPSNKNLTLKDVNEANPGYLHRFHWLADSEIGELHYTWNFLEGWYEPFAEGKPKIVHLTQGGPWFDPEQYPHLQEVDYAEDWLAEKELYEKYNKGEV